MSESSVAIAYLDAERLRRALQAGIAHVVSRRELLNRINVFPVPDGDTGTNLSFTLRAVGEVLQQPRRHAIGDLLQRVADAALDGARGNSGAIMAQYFQGMVEATRDRVRLNAQSLADVAERGSQAAWEAMAEPVRGAMPSVLEAFGEALGKPVRQGISDIRIQFRHGLEGARKALARTPEQLPALRQAGVVDAGGQGFVDLLEGIWHYLEEGRSGGDIRIGDDGDAAVVPRHRETDEAGQYRFCTECIIQGEALDRGALLRKLSALPLDSLVVAGSDHKLRVHLHTDNPAEAFLACEEFGDLTSQKADDMHEQRRLMDLPGQVAVVTDSGADIPEGERERLNIQMVPVRVNFGDEEYLDKVTLQPAAFYRLLEQREVHPQTSQPPPGDFRRQFELLTGHGYQVISINISRKLSGTLQAAESAAERTDGEVRVLNSLNASAGQGLMVMTAAERVQEGADVEEVVELMQRLRQETRSFGFVDDLKWGVRGGRVPAWAEHLAAWLKLFPVLANSPDGRLTVQGVQFGRRRREEKIAAYVNRHLAPDRVYRLMIAHCQASERAHRVRRRLLNLHPLIHSCLITDAGPAVGVHLGPGGLIIGVQPQADS